MGSPGRINRRRYGDRDRLYCCARLRDRPVGVVVVVAMIGRLITVRLHGPLGDKYGGEHHFAVRSPREAFFALDANYPGFRKDFISYRDYSLFADGAWLPPDAANGDPASVPAAREIDIIPLIEGRAFLAIPLLGAIGITGFAAQIIGGLIISALLIGVSMLLSPKPKKKTEREEDSKKDESYIFSGPENVTEQGVAVPLVYGRLHVGSVVISAGLEVSDVYVPPASTVPGTPTQAPPGGEATAADAGNPPIIYYEGLGIYGPQGWTYIGWGQSWSPDVQGMVTGHSFNRPDGLYSYNTQTGKFYVGGAQALNQPTDNRPDGGGQ
jgi:predicted phage tail protein